MICAGRPRWTEGAEADVPKKTSSNNRDKSFQMKFFILPYRLILLSLLDVFSLKLLYSNNKTIYLNEMKNRQFLKNIVAFILHLI